MRQAVCTRASFIATRAGLPEKHAKVHFYATSLSSAQASLERLRALIRGHWGIENRLHHVKDRTWLEDRHWLKNPATAQTFTFLRTLAADVLRRVRIPGGTGREHCPERIEYMRGDVLRPMRGWCVVK